MELYCESIWNYRRLKTRTVKVGNITIGGDAPLRVQTMTTTDTMDTAATVEQSIRCIRAGSELVRITAPSKREAENLKNILSELNSLGYDVPLVADIHFTPNAAEIAARIIHKVRVNPGNYVDKKKFEQIEYTDEEYREEIERIRERFTPLVRICKEHGTAMRIGTNHGSLSDRIMSRYGDTAKGMVESAMEFLRIARSEDYHQVVLSMKSSNPLVMVQAYRLLVHQMMNEFGECYPLHLGVTEAGDGEDGRIKSAIGIGTLLEDGIGDTVRVSLTEDPEFEIPVCKDIVRKYEHPEITENSHTAIKINYNPFEYSRRRSNVAMNIGGTNVPVVIASYFQAGISDADLHSIGYAYDASLDKWHIGDAAADYIYAGDNIISFSLPGSLRVINNCAVWNKEMDGKSFPLYTVEEYSAANERSSVLNFIKADVSQRDDSLFSILQNDPAIVLCLGSSAWNGMQQMRAFFNELNGRNITCPVIITSMSTHTTIDEQLIHFSREAGGLFLDGMGDGIWLSNKPELIESKRITGRTYLETLNNSQFLNNTSFSILQAVRCRISRTEYISCPSCGRTLFDLQETTARIRSVTSHLKGLKIAVMGCIVNGPGEMADADFGYVGSGIGKITLYKGKEVVKKNIDSDIAVEELITLLRENNVWIEPAVSVNT